MFPIELVQRNFYTTFIPQENLTKVEDDDTLRLVWTSRQSLTQDNYRHQSFIMTHHHRYQHQHCSHCRLLLQFANVHS